MTLNYLVTPVHGRRDVPVLDFLFSALTWYSVTTTKRHGRGCISKKNVRSCGSQWSIKVLDPKNMTRNLVQEGGVLVFEGWIFKEVQRDTTSLVSNGKTQLPLRKEKDINLTL